MAGQTRFGPDRLGNSPVRPELLADSLLCLTAPAGSGGDCVGARAWQTGAGLHEDEPTAVMVHCRAVVLLHGGAVRRACVLDIDALAAVRDGVDDPLRVAVQERAEVEDETLLVRRVLIITRLLDQCRATVAVRERHAK
jgi:hypothetical protein